MILTSILVTVGTVLVAALGWYAYVAMGWVQQLLREKQAWQAERFALRIAGNVERNRKDRQLSDLRVALEEATLELDRLRNQTHDEPPVERTTRNVVRPRRSQGERRLVGDACDICGREHEVGRDPALCRGDR